MLIRAYGSMVAFSSLFLLVMLAEGLLILLIYYIYLHYNPNFSTILIALDLVCYSLDYWFEIFILFEYR